MEISHSWKRSRWFGYQKLEESKQNEMVMEILPRTSNLMEQCDQSKYSEEDNWVLREVSTTYGVSVWRYIRALWPIMKNHSYIRVKNGNKTSF